MKKIEEHNTLVFIVDLQANKRQIFAAVKTLYEVKAVKVNTLIRYVVEWCHCMMRVGIEEFVLTGAVIDLMERRRRTSVFMLIMMRWMLRTRYVISWKSVLALLSSCWFALLQIGFI